MKKEYWRFIKGYEGLYMCSSFGRVKCLDRHWNTGIGIVFKKGHILSQSMRRDYLKVSLCKGGVVKIINVHRLVALTFKKNPLKKKFINHKDGNKLNNHKDNVEWCTTSENILHAYRLGLSKSWLKGRSGLLHNRSVAVINTKTNKTCNITEAAIKAGVCNMHMNRMINGTRTNWTNFIKYKN